MIGQTISHYKILEKLGGGGMGVVYRAEDLKLRRPVALKFLPPELTRDEEAKKRFIHEAQTASALQHHNICTIHEIEETPDGQLFICMDCYDGETLKQKIARGPLSAGEAVDIAKQAAEGLSKAHGAGMVHRDIKPANILVTKDGVVKILDFGLAKLAGQTKVTRTGTTVGTVAYMSPEQAQGEEVDHRSDIFSFGVVLYELLTGKLPFRGEHQAAVLYSILNDEPEPVTSRRSNVPMELERIVRKALAKAPSERYQHVEDMLVDLRAIRSGAKAHAPSHQARRRWTRTGAIWAAAGAMVVIVIALALAHRFFMPAGPSHAGHGQGNRTMLVVLPFENLGAPQDEYFANGTTDAITARLAGITGLGVIARQSAMQYKKTTKSIRQIGKELGVDYILQGTVQREKPGDPTSRVRVIPQLVRVADETNVWAETYDEEMTQVFHVQSTIAERVATQLDVALLEPERRAIEKKPTENLEAYDDYLRGMNYSFSEDIPDMELCAELLQKAVKADPHFAEAWAGLAATYRNLYWVVDRPGTRSLATRAARQAERLAPDLPETHLALGHCDYMNYEFAKALAQYQTAQNLRPSGDAERNIGYALRRLGRWQDALTHFENASRLMPREASVFLDGLGMTKMCMRQFDAAEQDLDRSIELAPRSPAGYYVKARNFLARNGDVASAKQVNAEMLRRTAAADIGMSLVPQVFDWVPEMALFPGFYAKVFDAFEAGPIDRFRVIQPAMVAETHLARAVNFEAMADRRSAAARYDSARVCYERIIRSNPESAYIPFYHSALGFAYAGLGRKAEAIREGETAVRMVPVSNDAVFGPELLCYLAMIYVKCGEYDRAIDELETLSSVPSNISPGLLRVDPTWNPIRDNPRFRKLVEGKKP